MNLRNSYQLLFKQTQKSYRSFGSSSINASWMDKLRPISIKDEEKKPSESYFDIFKSRKGISADVLNTLNKKPMQLSDYFSFEGLKMVKEHLQLRVLLHDQRYINERVDILGFDLAAAHFIVARAGKVRFRGHSTWVQILDNDECHLPKHYDENYIIEEIDASNMKIIYDGLWNLDGLSHLKALNLSHCPTIDDWCIDRVCGQFSESLEELNISHCPLITARSLETIARLRCLKRLIVNGLGDLPNANLICLLLQDATPGLKIEGISL